MSQPSTPLYRRRVADQIVVDLRGQILSGTLADGARLPSERHLAAHYDVSAPTIREAVRVLTALGPVTTRSGSRATVTANGDTLLAMSIASVVQFEDVTAADVFSLLGALNAYAAEQSVHRASDQDISDLRVAAEQAAEIGATAVRLVHQYHDKVVGVLSINGRRLAGTPPDSYVDVSADRSVKSPLARSGPR